MSGNCFTFISIVDLFNRIFATIAPLAALPNRLTVMFRATDVHWMGVHSSFTLIHGKHERAFARKKENYPPAKCNSCLKRKFPRATRIAKANSSRCFELRRPLNYSHYKRDSLHILAHPSRNSHQREDSCKMRLLGFQSKRLSPFARETARSSKGVEIFCLHRKSKGCRRAREKIADGERRN